MFTNADIKKTFDTYKVRICVIGLNNGKRIFVGYNGSNSIQLSDISFETMGNCDVLAIKKIDNSSGRNVHYTTYVTTEFIEFISIMSEEDADYRIDPLLMS